jgi:hypothetical protein
LVIAGYRSPQVSVNATNASSAADALGAQQNPQRLSVAVGAGCGKTIGIHSQRVQRGQMRVNRVGFTVAAITTTGLLNFDHRQSGSVECTGQADTVAAGTFQCDGDPRTWSVLGDPSQCFSESRRVVADLFGSQRDSSCRHELQWVCWSRWVSPPTTATLTFANTGIAISGVLSRGHGRTGLEGVTERRSVTGHASSRRGQASHQANRWARSAPANAEDESATWHASLRPDLH